MLKITNIRQFTTANFSRSSWTLLLGSLLFLAGFVASLGWAAPTAFGATQHPVGKLAEPIANNQQWPTGLWQAYQAAHPKVIGGSFTQKSELTATDAAMSDYFGTVVSVSGDGSTALIGALNKTIGVSGVGAAYIFTKSNGNWLQSQELTASDGARDDEFGYSVSLSNDGSIALIGAIGKNTTGAVYIFTKSGGNWLQSQELTASDAAYADQFGSAASLSGDGSTALIGAAGKNNTTGAAYIFTKSGGNWLQSQELTASDAATSDFFGLAVSLSNDGSTALIGDYHKNGNTGAVYIFTKSNGNWLQSQELTASDAATSDLFGIAITLSGDGSTALIGASFHNNKAGAAYIFTKSNGNWLQSQELTASDAAGSSLFGYSASLSSDGSTALIGAIGGNNKAGAAYIFTKSNGNWLQSQELTASDAVSGDDFGSAVSLSSEGTTALIGAIGRNNRTGTAYIFTAPPALIVTNSYDSGTGSLRDIISKANSIGGGTITFDPSVTAGGWVTITLQSALPQISTPITITGPGANLVTVSGNNAYQVFNVANATNFTLNGLTIAYGSASTGGGIYNSGTLTITNSIFAANSASSEGGAIYIDTGGSISSLTNSTFISNSALNGIGGAIDNNYGSINNLTNSTFISNSAPYGGGAIDNNFGSISLTNSTFTSNSANSGYGGAIYNDGSISVTNSLFANSPSGGNCYKFSGTFTDGGYNLSDDASCDFSATGSHNNVTNLNLDSLKNNGGTTPTIALLPGSAALFAGNPANCPATDQRGQTRPQPVGTNCDVGAFESNLQLSDTISAGSNPNPSKAGQSVVLTATITGNGVYTPTGSIAFTNTTTNTSLGSSPLDANGNAVVTPTFSLAGNFNIAVGYTSNLTFTSAITNFTQVVSGVTSTTLTSAPNPSTVGQTVIFTATVSGNGFTPPSGTVTFTNTTTNQPLGTATLANGLATVTTVFSSTGTYTITATYGGDSIFTGSNASTTQQVTTLPPTIAVFAGNGQSTPISTTFPVALAAIVRDGTTGNPLAGVTVIFQAPTSGASGTFSPTNSTTFTATTNANGVATANAFVANGTVGSYQVTATANSTASSAVFNLVNSPANSASGYTYYLPFLANNANNFTTYLVFQNTANVSSTVTISFYDNNGNTVGAASGTCSSVAALGECIVPNPFASGKQGQGIIVSQQPLNVIVSEATPYGGSAYAVTAGASNSLIAPVAIHNGLVDFTTQLSVFNGGNTTVTGTVQFFDQNGNHVTAADKSFTLAAHSTTIYDQSQDNTLSNFYGWAQVTSPAGSQLVAQTLEQRPSVKFVAIVNAQFNPQTTLYAPAIFNGAFGNFVTGANLVNPNSQSVTVTITYYKNDGTASTTTPFTIAANAVTGIFQGANSGNGLPTGGLPSGWNGSATIKTSGSNGIIMFVNEQGGTTATGSDQSGTYGAAVSGSSTVGLPVMANGAFGGYITGATIENITSSPVTATVQYYDLSGNAVGTAKTVTIGGNASAALYQGGSDQALASGFYGTAQVTVTSGPSSSLLVTTNAQSNAFFYSYTEPSS